MDSGEKNDSFKELFLKDRPGSLRQRSLVFFLRLLPASAGTGSADPLFRLGQQGNGADENMVPGSVARDSRRMRR